MAYPLRLRSQCYSLADHLVHDTWPTFLDYVWPEVREAGQVAWAALPSSTGSCLEALYSDLLADRVVDIVRDVLENLAEARTTASDGGGLAPVLEALKDGVSEFLDIFKWYDLPYECEDLQYEELDWDTGVLWSLRDEVWPQVRRAWFAFVDNLVPSQVGG